LICRDHERCWELLAFFRDTLQAMPTSQGEEERGGKVVSGLSAPYKGKQAKGVVDIYIMEG